MTHYPEPIKILCVDDEPSILRALARVFLDEDYEIVLAGSGEEGLQVLGSSGPFQLVISDYRMPVMNGVDFLRKVYSLYPDSVRIVLSGYADIGSIVSAVNEGHIYKFMSKPWNDDDLRDTIRKCLERYFLLKKNRELLEELAQANRELENKVQQRTEQLELRNRALEFTQSLLGNLPVGVVGIDTNDMISYCNHEAATYLAPVCRDIFGDDISSCCGDSIGKLVERVRHEQAMSAYVVLGDVTFRILGRIMTFGGSESVLLVFMEMET